MNKFKAAMVLLALCFSSPLAAQQKADEHSAHHTADASTAALTDGEVRRVDKSANKITIRHGEIQNLDMPPMTMVFQATDPGLLNQVKPGDKIRFRAEKSGSTYTVTRIEPVK